MEKDVKIEKIYNEELGFEDDIEGLNDEDNTDKADELNEKDESNDEQPFNVDSIRIDQQVLSVKYVYDLYKEGVLTFNPDFQRQYIWKARKGKSRLIESLMLRIPIPAFYFYEKEDSRFTIIDGQQRLQTIFDFLDGKFRLFDLEYLNNQYNGKKFDDLALKYKQRINRTQLNINILDDRSPQKVIYDIFRRINSGGIPLNPQEMRNALCSNSVRSFLKKGANSLAFKEAIRDKINDSRFDKQETFLRFVSIYRRFNYDTLTLSKLNPSKLLYLMDKEIEILDGINLSERSNIFSAFERSMIRCHKLFGQYAFINISLDPDTNKIIYNKDIINKPLLLAFSVLLANPNIDTVALENNKDAVLYLAKALENNEYQNSISKTTGDERNIIKCLNYSLEVLKKCKIIN